MGCRISFEKLHRVRFSWPSTMSFDEYIDSEEWRTNEKRHEELDTERKRIGDLLNNSRTPETDKEELGKYDDKLWEEQSQIENRMQSMLTYVRYHNGEELIFDDHDLYHNFFLQTKLNGQDDIGIPSPVVQKTFTFPVEGFSYIHAKTIMGNNVKTRFNTHFDIKEYQKNRSVVITQYKLQKRIRNTLSSPHVDTLPSAPLEEGETSSLLSTEECGEEGQTST